MEMGKIMQNKETNELRMSFLTGCSGKISNEMT